jgi:hypothetical protein
MGFAICDLRLPEIQVRIGRALTIRTPTNYKVGDTAD